MQMYVNDFDRYVKTADENRSIGIILCHQKNDALVDAPCHPTPTSMPPSISCICPARTSCSGGWRSGVAQSEGVA